MRYGRHLALDALDFSVAAGEIVGILGPNGAGKTSLLRLLCTGRRPSSGELSIFGLSTIHHPPSTIRRSLGIAGDDAIHADALSGRENAVLLAQCCGLGAADAEGRVAVLLRHFGLEADGDRPVAHYSMGMRRKLLLLEALVHEPRLVILDEPTIGLDREGRDALRAILRERAAAGVSVVLASNDPSEPERLCDRVVFLHRGRAVLEGAPRQLLEKLGAEPRVEVRHPDLGDVFLAATGSVLREENVPEEVAR